ncbi:MAG: hypothetical protein JWN72_113 [Thermoleophilia bacterium]|nr:hypothetical protein [Thermoleophilia bacterium]
MRGVVPGWHDRRMFTSRATLTALTTGLLAAAIALGAPSSGLGATGTGATFGPSVVTTELHGVRTTVGTRTVLHWTAAGRTREVTTYDIDPVDDHSVTDVNGSTSVFGGGFVTRLQEPIITRHAADVEPDSGTMLDYDLMGYAWPLIAGVRGGTRTLTTVRSGGRTYLKGTLKLASNECAALGSGSRTVLLHPTTLVPMRVTDMRGAELDMDLRFAPRARRAGDFAPLKVVGTRDVSDAGFIRASLKVADARVAFAAKVPTALPTGFTLDHAGYARAGRHLGPEGYFPRGGNLFYAQWRHGLEAVDYTTRAARGTLAAEWDRSDPFGTECGAASTTEIEVGTATGHYAVGEQGNPRLWWRTGGQLFTVSGPFSAAQLRTIAESVRPLA